MRRHAHYVRENENSETMHSCIFMDTETDEIDLGKGETGYKLRFGWACHTRRNNKGKWTKPTWRRFDDIADFWLWVSQFTRKGRKTWMWVHNSSFDYPVMDAFGHLEDIGWEMKGAIIDAPPTVVRYKCQGHTLVLCDTLNIWRMSLKELGKKCGLPKLEMPAKWGDKEKDDAYCVRDVEIVRKSVCDWADFLRNGDLGGFCPTVAAQAMRTFRHRFLDDRILIEDNPVSLGLARNCYHGGRCEAGFIGRLQQPVYSIDVNSMYPYVMSYCEMPLRIKGLSRFIQPYHLRNLLREYCLCAHCRIETDEPFIGIVREKKLVFPVGKFDAYLTSPEIKYALERDCIKSVHLCASYEKGIPFRRFALELYEHKERAARNGNVFEASHWKLLLNSFYGKWGQSGRKWKKVGECERGRFESIWVVNAQTDKRSLRRYFAGSIYERADDSESSESHPAIAAHVTAEARMVLWTLIRQIPPEDYFYCDTDGLLVSLNGFEIFRERLDDYVLGRLKHVDTYADVRINGCKDLVLDGQEKIKGISKKADCLDEGIYRQLRWHSLAGLLCSRRIDMPRTTVITKSLSRAYTKGTILPSGFVVPLHLEDW